jgi:transcriptional regulator with XRE-family HTH domain
LYNFVVRRGSMKNYFAKNISYLIDNNIINVETILKITNHNSPGLISMWKSGERNIMTNDLIAIANFLNYTVDDLINKDLSKKDSKLSKSELDVLFDKHKDILTDDDKETIKFIIEKRKREIDKELDGE